MVGMGEEGGHHRGDARGMQERLHRAGTLGLDLVQAMDRRILCDAPFDLAAHPVEVGDWPWPTPRGQIRQEKARPCWRVDPDRAERQGMRGPPPPAHRHQ